MVRGRRLKLLGWFKRGNVATALCNDGTYSYAAHHQGACSYHGGVAVFYR
ncbi:DUF3761 domain-containing protein [Streptomyces griseochromogenes]